MLSVQAASGLDEKQVEAGEAVYNDYCQTCHGANLVNSGQTFDLRKMRKDERARFENSVTNGKNQMTPWKGVLDSGQLAGATLDVLRQEPPPADHPFWRHPKIVLTPHTSARTDREASVAQIAGKIRALERGEPVAGVVDRLRGY